MMRLRHLLTAVLLVSLCANVAAHRQSGVVSTLRYSTNGELEITHRIHAHDALALLPDSESLESVEGRAHVALHVENRFGLRTGADQPPLALSILGVEVDGNDVYVYQVAPLSDVPVELLANNSMLDDTAAAPAHVVNVEIQQRMVGNTLASADRWQSLALP
ncbi:MAG: DUF6702 family protein [Pseudomonadota bacterium]